ncbi:MAG: 4'-phosphopantetheinyl transferase family protein, partial [Candidatus Helarchaeota archaeon]
VALYAFTQNGEIGIDIEKIREIPEMDTVVKKFFSKYEKDTYNQLPDNQKKKAFFNCWTRKEAFIKAIGEGLYFPLNKFDVSLKPNEPVKIISINENKDIASKWTLQDVKPKNGYSAACAIMGGKYCFHYYNWSNFLNY